MAVYPWKLTARSAAMGFVVVFGSAVGFTYPEYRETIAHAEHEETRVTEACSVAMRSISEGKVKLLRQTDADDLASKCGLAAFLDAPNADGSRIRLASN